MSFGSGVGGDGEWNEALGGVRLVSVKVNRGGERMGKTAAAEV